MDLTIADEYKRALFHAGELQEVEARCLQGHVWTLFQPSLRQAHSP